MMLLCSQELGELLQPGGLYCFHNAVVRITCAPYGWLPGVPTGMRSGMTSWTKQLDVIGLVASYQGKERGLWTYIDCCCANKGDHWWAQHLKRPQMFSLTNCFALSVFLCFRLYEGLITSSIMTSLAPRGPTLEQQRRKLSRKNIYQGAQEWG